MVESQWYLEVNGQKIGPFALDHIQGLYADGEIKGYHQVTSDQLEGQWITVQELVDSLRIAAPPPPTSDFSAPPSPPADDEDEDEPKTSIAIPVLESRDEEAENDFENSLPQAPTEEEEDGEEAPPPPPEAPAEFNSDFQPPPRPPDLLSATAAAAEAAKKLAADPAPVKTLPPEPPKQEVLAPVNDPAISMLSSLQLFKERQEKTTETYDPTLVIQSDMLSRGNQSATSRLWIIAVVAGVILGCISWGVLKTLKNKAKAPSGTMTQISNHSTSSQQASQPITKTAPPVTTNVASPANNSAFKPAEGLHEPQHRLAPPRPIVAPQSAPAPVRQFEPQRDQQVDTAQPNEVPPQPQYAPQYQAYPPPNAGNPETQQVPRQPYVDPNNPTAPPVYPAGNEIVPQQQPQPAMPQGGPPPGTGSDNFAQPSVPQVVPQEQQDIMLQQQQLQQQNQAPNQ
jgi:hypothetical protein